jgi:subtilisin family serine protease
MKKQYYILILFCIFLSGNVHAQNQEGRFYYAYDEKIILDEVYNKMVVSSMTSCLPDIKTLLKKSNIEQIEWLSDSICIVTISVSQQKSLKDHLLQTNGIKSVHPLYKTKNGLEMGVTDEIVMRFKEKIPQEEIDKLYEKYQISVRKITKLYQLVSVPYSVDALEIANLFQESGLVCYSHPNFIAKVEPQTVPNDPYFINQFYLHNTGQTMPNGHNGTPGADINAPEAWDITKGNSNIIVAVLDEGVTSNHPDLPNTRQVRLPGSNFATGSSNDPSPSGNDNHGNSCAGVIAASHNSEGIAGIAPNCKIMPIRIPFGSYPAQIYADAITFAKDNGADVLSNSWGYGDTNPDLFPVIKNAIEDATINGRNGKGCVVVFASGNTAEHSAGYDGFITFPSNVEVAGVITVGASDRYDAQANYSPTSDLGSSENQIIDIVAPSHRAYSCQISTETFEVWSIDIPDNAGYNPVKNDDCGSLPIQGSTMPTSGTNFLSYTGYFGGTSAACPQVAGIAALILSLNPFLTQQDVANIIESTSRKAGGYSYQTTSGIPNGTWNTQMGHGVLDAYAAVQAACATTVNFTDQTVTSDTTVTSCGDIYVQDVLVEDGAKLTLDAAGEVTIDGEFEIGLGSELEINTGQ